MSAPAKTVMFLEELDAIVKPAISTKPVAPDVAASTSKSEDNDANAKAATTAGVKRKGGLIQDFFTTKRQKTATGTPSASSSASGSLNSPQKLNSIPFSLTAFRNNLSPEEDGLLALECASISPIWCAQHTSCARC